MTFFINVHRELKLVFNEVAMMDPDSVSFLSAAYLVEFGEEFQQSDVQQDVGHLRRKRQKLWVSVLVQTAQVFLLHSLFTCLLRSGCCRASNRS